MHSVENEDDYDSASLYVSVINAIKSSSSSDWMTTFKVNNKVVEAQLDTGAKCNVMSQRTYLSLNVNTPLWKNSKKLTSYSGHEIPILGTNIISSN